MIAGGSRSAPGHRGHVGTLTLGVSVACLASTAAISWSPQLLFGLHAPELHLVLDSVDASIAAVVAYLLWGQYRRERQWRQLLLTLGLLLLVTAPLVEGVAHLAREPEVGVWWPQAVRGLAASLVSAGALARHREVSTRAAAITTAGVGLVVATVGTALWTRSSLPVPVTESLPSAASPAVTGHPLLLLAQAFGAMVFLIAALVFTSEAVRDVAPDPLLLALGPACVLAAFSRVHYVLFPSIYSGWIYTGDVLRTLGYLVLLVGAAAEIARFWAHQSDLAVRADRRRLARELHDGVVQELGFIAAESHALGDPEPAARIRDAAMRGLDEARAAVEALDRGGEESFSFQLHRMARQVTDRYGVRVLIDLDVTMPVAPEESHALLRITREAASNAARHGGAASIGIGLTRDTEGRRLVVHDDGAGFDPTSTPSRGYGLISMRDRAKGLGGRLGVRSEPGRGTTVTVTW